jgi:hypothetical protein
MGLALERTELVRRARVVPRRAAIRIHWPRVTALLANFAAWALILDIGARLFSH